MPKIQVELDDETFEALKDTMMELQVTTPEEAAAVLLEDALFETIPDPEPGEAMPTEEAA